MRRALTAILRAVDLILEWFVAALVAFLVVIVASQFVDRHFIDVPMMAPDQFVRVGLIWLTFVGFAAAVRARENIRIDLVDRFIPPRVRRSVETLFDLVLLVLLGVLIVEGWRVVEAGRSQILLGTPLTAAVPFAALFVGCILIAFFIALRLAARLLGVELPGDGADPHGVRQDPV